MSKCTEEEIKIASKVFDEWASLKTHLTFVDWYKEQLREIFKKDLNATLDKSIARIFSESSKCGKETYDKFHGVVKEIKARIEGTA